MNNFITVKKDILFLEGKVNEIQTKDGNVIQYVSAAIIVKEDNCKIECSCKIKPEDYIQMSLQPYESYQATLQLDISDKIKIKILEIN